MKIVFVHAGRLTKEKGSDLVVELCRQIEGSALAEKVEIHVFGKGVYAEEFERMAANNDWLIMHGFQPREELFKVWDQSHYTLMPSRFLETFGLSALEACTHGSVLIGFKKGGLDQFVDEFYAIDENHGLYTILEMLVGKFVDWQRLLESKHVKEVAAKYSAKRWLYRFEELSGLAPYQGHHITMISDYGTMEGGIESYIQDATTLLRNNGYNVSTQFGTTTSLSVWKRYRSVLRALWNKQSYKKLRQSVEPNTDLLWWHSVHRYLGHTALDLTLDIGGGVGEPKSTHCANRYMVHDVGLLHPRPQKVYTEHQLVDSVGFWGFIREGGRIFTPFSALKRVSISRILKKIKNHGFTVLVPSQFLVKHCIQHGLGTTETVHPFPHTIETTYCEQDGLTGSDE